MFDMPSLRYSLVAQTAPILALCCVVTLTSWSASARGQSPTDPALIDVQKLGPQVGTKVPDFSLEDQHGVMRSLHSVMGPKGVVLVFFRSADW
jgi:hypothetical protein